jgi:L-lactate dehydrogenase complex protein LldG
VVAVARVSAREEMLAVVRAAIRGAEPPLVPRAYRVEGTLATDLRVAQFCERVDEYRAEVVRVDGGVDVAIGAALAARGARTVVVPQGVPPHWRPGGVELVEDTGLSAHELDSVDGVVTGCTVAIGETGTIVLTAAPHEGRRALTLVPDLHVCVVEERQVVELVPEAIAVLAPLVRAERRPLTFVSGPSATSDIELSRVEGVHGPRDLVVVVTA